jgi:hypothetical protein
VTWTVRIRPAAGEGSVTGSHRFLSWCDELGGVRFRCPRCGRHAAVLRRWRPVGCHTVHWLLCLSVLDRGPSLMSDEVVRELVADALGHQDACRLLGGTG